MGESLSPSTAHSLVVASSCKQYNTADKEFENFFSGIFRDNEGI
jgi:hypothetical protein